jgi:IS30 family transposase
LTLEDRVEIRVGIELGESNAEIAERIGKHRCTVWRERRVSPLGWCRSG